MGPICDFLKISFTIFLLRGPKCNKPISEQKCSETDPKKSQIYPNLGSTLTALHLFKWQIVFVELDANALLTTC